MLDLINKLQKDVKKFQKTIQAESDELVRKIKKAASKSNIELTKRNVEKVIQNKINQFEPALLRLVKDMKENAAKAGIDLGDIEAKVQKATKVAREKMTRGGRSGSQRSSAGKAKSSASKAKPAAAAGKSRSSSTTKAAATSSSAGRARKKTSKKKTGA